MVGLSRFFCNFEFAMKPYHLTRLAWLTTLACALAGAAHAQEANYYYCGLSAGQSHLQLNEIDTTNSLLGTGNGAALQGHELQDAAYKILGGYQFNRNFALEAGYFDLGKFTYSATSPTGTLNGTYEVEGLNLDLIATVPMGERFSAFGRIGAQYANTRDSFSGTGTLTPANGNPSKRDTNLKVGVGLQYDISPSMQLRAEAERYRINDAFDNRGDINVFSLSLVFPIGRKATLDTFAKDSAGVKFDAITIEGNADRLGRTVYNDKLSLQGTKPSKALIACLQPDSCVDVEMTGAR
jgi:OOP family OmpA-OmpF porin